MLRYIDKVFREYGVKELGEETMSRLTDEQIEEARVYAFTTLSEQTRSTRQRQPEGFVEDVFCRKVQRMLGLNVTLQ